MASERRDYAIAELIRSLPYDVRLVRHLIALSESYVSRLLCSSSSRRPYTVKLLLRRWHRFRQTRELSARRGAIGGIRAPLRKKPIACLSPSPVIYPRRRGRRTSYVFLRRAKGALRYDPGRMETLPHLHEEAGSAYGREGVYLLSGNRRRATAAREIEICRCSNPAAPRHSEAA